MEALEQTVKTYILETFLPGEEEANLTQETQLIGSGILDSISTLKLAEFLEQEFKISVEPHELDADNLGNLTAIGRFVRSKQ